MAMVLMKSSTACALLVFLCAALSSAARLHPAGAEGNGGILSTKASVVTATINSIKEKSLAAIEGNSKKLSVKQVVRKCGNANSSSSSVEGKRSLRSRLTDEGDGGFVSFTADYHSPRHHPPKNNK